MRGERHKSVLKSSENKMVFERKMERGAAEIVQIISAVMPTWVYKELPSHMWWKSLLPCDSLLFSTTLQTICGHLNLDGGIWQ